VISNRMAKKPLWIEFYQVPEGGEEFRQVDRLERASLKDSSKAKGLRSMPGKSA
jgi:hypothetical protein